MPEESDEWRPERDDEGGPVKSFLEHLEDLRWVLIKSLVALGIGFVICLVAGDWVFAALTYPLKHARVRYRQGTQVVTFMFGTNRLGLFQLPPSEQGAFGSNHFVNLHLEPVQVGTNVLLALRQDSDGSEAQKLIIPIVGLGPATAFMVAVSVAMYAGVLLASPFILYFVTSFVFPALKMKERKYVHRGMFFGLGLFLLGVGFCYFILMPVALSASVVYTQWLGLSAPQWRAEEYVSFVSKFMLGMGLGFEMPVILLVLVKIGVLNYAILSKARRYVIVINFVLGAVLTTPEILTQILMALPLQILYEITVWVTWYWERREKKREAAAETAAGGAVGNA